MRLLGALYHGLDFLMNSRADLWCILCHINYKTLYAPKISCQVHQKTQHILSSKAALQRNSYLLLF